MKQVNNQKKNSSMDRSQTNRNNKVTLIATDRQKANEINKIAFGDQEQPIPTNSRGQSVLKRYMSNFNQTASTNMPNNYNNQQQDAQQQKPQSTADNAATTGPNLAATKRRNGSQIPAIHVRTRSNNSSANPSGIKDAQKERMDKIEKQRKAQKDKEEKQ